MQNGKIANVVSIFQVWQSCPPGTFSVASGLWDVDNCTQCTGGSYCSQPNATAVTGQCDAGYYCTLGSDTNQPDVNATGTAGPCPTGHYCGINTVTPTPCPAGKFFIVFLATNLDLN